MLAYMHFYIVSGSKMYSVFSVKTFHIGVILCFQCRFRHVFFQSGKSSTIRESNGASGVRKAHYAQVYLGKTPFC